MNHLSRLVLFLALVGACSKETPSEEPPAEPVGGSRRVEFVLRVKYPPLKTPLSDGSLYEHVFEFDKQDQMEVTGEGIGGVLSYDRYYVFPGEIGFSGFLDYEGDGDPPADMPLQIRRINPARSYDGTPPTDPVMAQSSDPDELLGGLTAAIAQYGAMSGTCTFGNPSVSLSLSNSFFFVRLVFNTPFPDSQDKRVTLTNGNRTYGPFHIDIASRSADMVWVFPAGTELKETLLDVQDVARFPVKPSLYPLSRETVELSPGCLYEDVIHLHDVSAGHVVIQNPRAVVYQSVSGPTDHSISAIGESSNLYLSNIHIEGEDPIVSNNHLYIWVEGECKAIAKGVNSSHAIYVSSLHLQGNGTLYAICQGVQNGAGICYGGSSSNPGDLVIDGNVSVVAQGSFGGAGIGTVGIAPSNYNWPDYNCKEVQATGGEGAPGIGAGRNRNRSVCQIKMGKIEIGGGMVDAAGGDGSACDIGVDYADLVERVQVDAGVTYDGVRGYAVTGTKDGLSIQYKKMDSLPQ